MNALIQATADGVLNLFYDTVPSVAAMSHQELNDLEHRCGDEEKSEEFTTRTAAHIVRSAVVMEQERRKGK